MPAAVQIMRTCRPTLTESDIFPDRMSYRRPFTDVLSALGTDADRGLSAADAAERLRQHGRNELQVEKGVPAWRKFLGQFGDPLVIMLLVATAISAVLWAIERETNLPYEAMAIFAIVLVNAILGFVQEQRAETAVAALRKMSAAKARVLRDGAQATIDAAELVPGDIILIEEGDTIPADARLIHITALQTGDSALTGESLPVEKQVAAIDREVTLGDRRNMVFSGTIVTYGRGRAVVVATGMETEMGHIAGLLERTEEEATPLQKQLDAVGRHLGMAVLIIAAVMITAIIVSRNVRGFHAIFDVLILGVALAVAAVPEGLPAVVTAVLSLGVQRAAKRKAIVRHLSAVEALGSANVIASDKTGTLTRNEMTVLVAATASGRVRFGGTGYEPKGGVRREDGGRIEGPLEVELRRTLSAADRVNNAVLQKHEGHWTVQGDPTEGALIVAALKAGLDEQALAARFGRLAEVPFSSERKLMTTVHSDAEQERLLVMTKGAPDVVLGRCAREQIGEETRLLSAERRAQIERTIDELAGEALRTLGVAYRPLPTGALDTRTIDERVEEDLVFLGLIGMMDPPRAEAKEAVARAKGAGIRPMMITGDHPVTAAVIARELGIAAEGRAVTGVELEAMAEGELDEVVGHRSVYARVNPEHKLSIVQALQRDGLVVAMTGDGVNDAPALKTADIGIAMGITGTDVSKEASDMILADDNFATIVAAVEEGRAIYANIRKFLRYLLSCNIGEVMTMFFGFAFAGALGLEPRGEEALVLPLLATHLLWINLVTDGAPAMALGVDPPDPGLMNIPPRPKDEGVITPLMWRGIIFAGAIIAAGTLLVIDASLPGGMIEGTGDIRYAQTMAFTTIVFFSLFNTFNSRSDERSAFRGFFTNRWLWAALALSLLLQAAVIYLPPLQRAFSTVPLTALDWARCAVAGSAVLWLSELAKAVRSFARF
jgi:Ca2+-transporting ATPase